METTAQYAHHYSEARELNADARLARAAIKAAAAAAAAERMAKALKVVAAKIQTTTRRGPAACVAPAGAGTTAVVASAISTHPLEEQQPVAIFQEKKADVAPMAAVTTKEAVASARIEQRAAEPRRLPVAPVPVAPTLTAAPQWPERRNGERLECSGDVEILSIQQGNGKVVRGKIRTLSVGGCYMETEAALEWGSRLAVVLKVDTLSLRTIAEVRTVKLDSKCWAGLEFAGMTAESYENLKGLIAARSAQNPMKAKALAQAAG